MLFVFGERLGSFAIALQMHLERSGSFTIALQTHLERPGSFSIALQTHLERPGSFAIALPDVGKRLGSFAIALPDVWERTGSFAIALPEVGKRLGSFSIALPDVGKRFGSFSIALPDVGKRPGSFSIALPDVGEHPGSFSIALPDVGERPGSFAIALPEVGERLGSGFYSNILLLILQPNTLLTPVLPKTKHMKPLIVASLLLYSIAGLAQTEPEIKKLTIFKNATAMVVKEGEVPVINGKVKLPIPEHTLFGTYFIGSNKDNSVKSIVFKNDTLKKKALCASIWQYLAGNINKPLSFSYSPAQGLDKTLTGKASAYDLYSGMLTFVTDAGRSVLLHTGSIYQVDFKETPNTHYWADSIQRMIVLSPEKAAAAIRLQQIHLTGNINWLPSYYLQLKDSKTARIEMKAMLENFAEDLNDAETELVVGAPQMIYSNTPDPMTYDYISVNENTNTYGRGAGARMYMQSNAMAKSELEETAGGSYFDTDFETGGEKSGDMYIYKLGKVSLPKNSKGSFPMFAATVEYQDKYEGTIGDITNFYRNRYVPEEEKTFDIFHSIEIKNTTSVPLTTASLMAVNEKGQFMAQDELKYTPVGGAASIRLSKAIDIVAKNTEEEKTREDNAKKIGKSSYSKVVLTGTISVENFQDKASTVSITKLLNGTVLNQNQEGKVRKKAGYNYINPQSEIKWEIDLGARQKKTITYNYEVYFLP